MDQTKPLISVLTATSGQRGSFLVDAYRSLCRQSVDWEWVVEVDGAISAPPSELARDVRISWAAHDRVLGPAASRNRALARCRGDLIQNLDDDDLLYSGALEALSDALATHRSAAFAFGDAVDFFEDGTERRVPLPFDHGLVAPGKVVAEWRHGPDDYFVPLHPAGVMWRKDVLMAYGGWTGLWAMDDTAIVMAVSTLNASIYIGRDTLRYRRHGGQLSHQQEARRQEDSSQAEFVVQRVAALRELARRCGPAEPH